MPRLPRPPIPVAVKCRVVLRQLGEMFIDDVIRANRFVPRVVPSRSLGALLHDRLPKLAELLGCTVKDLRLDHNPALENRMKLLETGQWVMVVPKGGKVVRYDPPANDPDSFLYRPHGAEFDGSHDVKTRIRGDHGQFSDNTLAKRERRRERKKAKKPLRRLDRTKPHGKIPRRKNPWPAKGSRKLRGKTSWPASRSTRSRSTR